MGFYNDDNLNEDLGALAIYDQIGKKFLDSSTGIKEVKTSKLCNDSVKEYEAALGVKPNGVNDWVFTAIDTESVCNSFTGEYKEVIKQAAEWFAAKGIEDFRLSASSGLGRAEQTE